jgi:general stress protein 26
MAEMADQKRINTELAAAGMTKFGLTKASTRYLHNIIYDNEHIQAVVYGRYEGGSGMLVGTERRLVFLNHKPLFTAFDELSYDVVSGVSHFHSGPLTSLTLHTKLGDYQLRYANKACADKFADFIEQRRFEAMDLTRTKSGKPGTGELLRKEVAYRVGMDLTPEARAFLTAHDTAVMSTVDREGNLLGSTVYYRAGDDGVLHMVTKADTAKARNILMNHQVAFTIFESDPPRQLQLQGYAEIETNGAVRDNVIAEIIRPREYKTGKQMPPITQIHAGSYVVVRFTPTNAIYRPFKGSIKKEGS